MGREKSVAVPDSLNCQRFPVKECKKTVKIQIL